MFGAELVSLRSATYALLHTACTAPCALQCPQMAALPLIATLCRKLTHAQSSMHVLKGWKWPGSCCTPA